MAEIPHHWRLYALQQQQLAQRSSVDDVTWGVEESLDAILSAQTADAVFDQSYLRRLTATGSRRERYRSSLRRRRASEVAGSADWVVQSSPDGRHIVAARSDLQHLQRSLKATDWALLMGDGTGIDRATTATALSITPEVLRTRLSRARRFAAQAVAA
jgi:hypothetical protein